MFPLKKLIEYDENATLDDLEESKILISDQDLLGQELPSDQSLHKKSCNKRVKRNSISKIEIIQCFISIFDDAIDQIHILSGGKKSENIIEHFNKSLEEKVANSFLHDPIFDKYTGEPYPSYFTKQKLRKCLTDSSKLNEFLILIRNELKEECYSSSIRAIANKIINKKYNEQLLLRDEHKNYKLLKNFKQISANQNREIEKDLDTITNAFKNSKDQTQDLLFENLLRAKYVKDWENARREQNEICCQRAEDELSNMIIKCDKEIKTEVRVSHEEELYLLEEEQDLQYSIKLWTDRLADETDQRLIQNQVLRERREELEKRYQALYELYEAHRKEINQYLRMKDKREKDLLEKERQRIAATKIQAWWRGMMVRCKLGPFNPNPKKRGKGKKGKKDKKGKK